MEIFQAAYERRIPVLLKGPTGCGKTRFVEHMSWLLAREHGRDPAGGLITVSCHDDLTSADLVGRYLLSPEGTTWLDGPLTQAVRSGAICYLDEVVEARKDTTVILHALTDHRRTLPVERLGTSAALPTPTSSSSSPTTPATRSPRKTSSRPPASASWPSSSLTRAAGLEAEIICHESGVDKGTARSLAFLGGQLRRLDEAGVIEGPGTRLLVHVASLIVGGISPRRASDVALVQALSDDADVQAAIHDVVHAVFTA